MTRFDHSKQRRRVRARRGSVYLLVLSTTAIIATLVGGTIYAQTQRLRGERITADASKARLAAMSGIEVARAWIAKDTSWRTTRTSGRWASNLALGDAKVDLDVIDTVDGVLANHPYHGVTITATARVGSAEQIMSAALVAKPVPTDTLKYAIATDGQLHLKSGVVVQAGTASVMANREVRNDGTIEGNMVTGNVNPQGTVFGSVQITGTSTALPDTAATDALNAIGTVLSVTSLDSVTLSPTANPYGTPNPYGIYILKSSSNVTIKDCQITGTLVVQASSSSTVNVGGALTINPTRSDLPALVVKGNLNLGATSGQITGLVYSTKDMTLSKGLSVAGALISGSTANSDAIVINDAQPITYNPALYTYPPVGFAKSVPMVLQPGSYVRQVK